MVSQLRENKIWSVILTILIAIEIFYFSTLKGGTGGTGIKLIPVIYHFSVFFLFAFFLFISINYKEIKISKVILVLIISIIYAISDEIHQIFIPLRDASTGDILIDTLGICFAVIIALIIKKKRIKKQI